MVFLENIWWLLVLIGVMIMVHELGHFWAARYFGVHVETFSFGFGPRLFGFRRGETDFRFSLILFGGYVKMLGEQPDDETTEDPRSFPAKPRWQRLIIAFAGPSMNVVLAVALVTGLFMVRFPKQPEGAVPGTIGHVRLNSPAARAGILEGDRIVKIDGQDNPSWEDILIREFAGAKKSLAVTVERDGELILFTITPELSEETGVGFAGWAEEMEIEVARILEGMDAGRAGLRAGDVLLSVNRRPVRSTATLQDTIRAGGGSPVEILYSRDGRRQKVIVNPTLTDIDGEKRWMIGVELKPRLLYTRLSLPYALAESVRQNLKSASLIYEFLRGLIERRMSAKSLEGPIRIAQLSGDAARQGPFAFVGLMAMISLHLAIINLLPIPVLDGGVILLLLVEMLMGRDLSMPVKAAVIKVGFLFLMIVVVFVLYNDLTKVLPPG